MMSGLPEYRLMFTISCLTSSSELDPLAFSVRKKNKRSEIKLTGLLLHFIS